jgi:hypothetical protein
MKSDDYINMIIWEIGSKIELVCDGSRIFETHTLIARMSALQGSLPQTL